MDVELYFYFVTVLAAIYAVVVRLLQNKLMNKTLMQEIQEKTKKINELTKAMGSGDKRKADEITKLNEEMMPKMNAMLFGQLKMMVVVLGVFFAFTWVAGHFDPTGLDDISFNLTDMGNNSFSGNFTVPSGTGQNANFWYITVKSYAGDSEVATNQSIFFVGSKNDQIIWIHSTGSSMSVSSDKELYKPGDSVRMLAQPTQPATRAIATVNSGTRFYVDLPLTIPLINVRRIYDSQSWFIFSAVIIGLVASPAISFVEKLLKGNAGSGARPGAVEQPK